MQTKVVKIDPFQIERHIPAVANREHSTINHPQVFRFPIGDIQYHSVSHTYIIRLFRFYLRGNTIPHKLLVKLVTDIKICIHVMMFI